MALVTFTAATLPNPTSVGSEDVYRHYQTRDSFNDPLGSPIDHGYFVAGLDPNDDQNSTVQWILHTKDYRELPVYLLRKEYSESDTGLLDVSEKPSDKIQAESGRAFLRVALEKENVFSLEAESKATLEKLTFYSAPVEVELVTVGKEFIETQGVLDPSLARLLFKSDVAQIDLAVRKFAEDILDLDIGEQVRVLESSVPEVFPLDFVKVDRLLTSPVQTLADVTLTKLFFEHSLAVAVVGPKKVLAESQVDATFGVPEKLYADSGTVGVSVVKTAPKRVSTVDLPVEITDTKLLFLGTPVSVNVVYPDPKRESSDTFNISVIAGNKKYFSSSSSAMWHRVKRHWYEESQVTDIGSTTSPKYEESNQCLVDIFAIGTTIELEQQDWILLRHLGTEDWRFLSVLDESRKVVQENGALDDTSFQEVFLNSSSHDVFVNSDGRVERLVVHKDENKDQKLIEMYVEYVDGFPFRATTMAYDFYGVKYYNATQTYLQDGNGGIVGDDFDVTIDFIPSSGGVIKTGSDVEKGHLVYADSIGLGQKALGTSAASSRVIGFSTAKLAGPRSNMHKEGLMEDVLTGLTPGATYFLSDTVPGGIQTFPPTAPGSVLKKIGYALDTNQLWVDLSQPLVIRT